MKQLVPPSRDGLWPQFPEHRRLLCRHLEDQGNDANWYTRSFNPYPLVITPDELHRQQSLQAVLHRAILALVGNYFVDQRLRQIVSLTEGLQERLRRLSIRPYRIGSYRPDFVHDRQGQIKICEINARFPTNAYLISHYINNVVPALQYLPQAAEVLPLAGLDQIPATFLDRLHPASAIYTDHDNRISGTNYNNNSPSQERRECSQDLVIAKGREKGWDVNFLLYELARSGRRYKLLEPQNLGAKDGHFVDLADAGSAGFGFVFLELHQDELEHSLDAHVLDNLCGAGDHLNDLRTIYLVHDKRFLALLFDGEIMADYLSLADCDFLRSHLVPTYVLSRCPQVVQQALHNQGQWVLKPNLFGKGQGIVFGKNVEPTVWAQALDNAAHQDYVLQHYIEQKQLATVNAGAEGPGQCTDLNVVGTLLCFDDLFFGPGIYRASAGDIVNVAGGGTVLFPVLSGSRGMPHV